MDNELKNFEERKKQLKKELEEIKEKAREIRKEIKEIKKKIRENKVGHNQDFGNTNIRVCNKFNDRIDYINRKREEFGFDKLSKPKVTELSSRHKNWEEIESDIIHFNINIEENKGIVNA